MGTQNVILVRRDSNCPVYLIDRESDQNEPLLFADPFEAQAWIDRHLTFHGPFGVVPSNEADNVFAVTLDDDNLRRYLAWANLMRADIKVWLREECSRHRKEESS